MDANYEPLQNKNKNENKRAIWKPSGEWSCFVGNVLVGVKDVSTYQKKKKNVYIYLVFFFFG